MIHTKQCEEIVLDCGAMTRNILHTYDIHLKISNNYISKYPFDIISYLIFSVFSAFALFSGRLLPF